MSRFLIHLSNVVFDRPHTVTFHAAGREWTLVNQSNQLPREAKTKFKDHAFNTGDLTTAANPGERIDAVIPPARHLARLLSFALGRDVQDTSCHHLDDQGQSIETRVHAGHIHPYAAGGGAPVTNYAKGDLQHYLEDAYPMFISNPEWWHKTLDFFLQSRMQPYVDTRITLLNVLMDRLAAQLPANRQGCEIDAALTPHLKKKSQLTAELTALMRKYSAIWSIDHTVDVLISRISDCNERPSFSKGIQRLCAHHQIAAPTGKVLSIRNKLLHEGDLITGKIDLTDYITELDSTITLILLRMLQYQGRMVFVRKLGIITMPMPALQVAAAVPPASFEAPCPAPPLSRLRDWAQAIRALFSFSFRKLFTH